MRPFGNCVLVVGGRGHPVKTLGARAMRLRPHRQVRLQTTMECSTRTCDAMNNPNRSHCQDHRNNHVESGLPLVPKTGCPAHHWRSKFHGLAWPCTSPSVNRTTFLLAFRRVRCAAAFPFSRVQPRLKMKKPLARPRQDRSGEQHRRIPFSRRRIEEAQRVAWIGIHMRRLSSARQIPRFGLQHYRRGKRSQVIVDLHEICSAE